MPFQEILLWSLVLSFVLALLYRVLTKPEEIRQLKEDLKDHRVKMKETQKGGDKEEINKALSEMMKMNQKQLKSNMKPMLASLILFLVVLNWMGAAFVDVVISLPFPIVLPTWELAGIPFVAIAMNIDWFWWYIIVTLPFTFVFRKLLGVE